MIRTPASLRAEALDALNHPALRGDPVGFSPFINLFLGEGRSVAAAVLDPERLSQSINNAIPGLLPSTITDLANTISKYAHGVVDPPLQPK